MLTFVPSIIFLFFSGGIPHSLTFFLHSCWVPRVLEFIYFPSVGFLNSSNTSLKYQFLAVILQVTLSFVMSSRSGFIGNTSKLARDKSEKNRIWWRRRLRNSQLCMDKSIRKVSHRRVDWFVKLISPMICRLYVPHYPWEFCVIFTPVFSGFPSEWYFILQVWFFYDDSSFTWTHRWVQIVGIHK